LDTCPFGQGLDGLNAPNGRRRKNPVNAGIGPVLSDPVSLAPPGVRQRPQGIRLIPFLPVQGSRVSDQQDCLHGSNGLINGFQRGADNFGSATFP
jgi:hypothetical protein